MKSIQQTKDVHVDQESFFEKIAFGAAKKLGSTESLIVHTILFVGIFSLHWFDFDISEILLILTTIVSLEAIYMSIFIQMTVNRQTQELISVQEDIEDIQEDVEEISEDIEDIQEDVEEISEDIVEEISDTKQQNAMNDKLQGIEETLLKLLVDIDGLKKK